MLLEHFAWGSVFWALVPLAVLTAAAAYVLVPESRDPAVPRLDLPGLGLSVAHAERADLHDHRGARARLGLGVAPSVASRSAPLLLLAFVAIERRAAHPMLDLGLFRDRRFSAASGAVTVTFFALFGFIFLITQYFQFVRGYGALSTGARILPVALSIAVASVVGALLAPRIGTKVVVTTGLLLFGTSFLWISTVSVDASYAAVIVPQMVLMGLGMGFISTPATESILLVLPPGAGRRRLGGQRRHPRARRHARRRGRRVGVLQRVRREPRRRRVGRTARRRARAGQGLGRRGHRDLRRSARARRARCRTPS